MTHPNPQRPLYLGIRGDELTGKVYAQFWNSQLRPMPEHAKDALLHGAVAAPLLPSLTGSLNLLDEGYTELENGFGIQDDSSLHVAVRTDMPNVSPTMVDWWFGWHSEEPQRYKLWHPRAHVHAQWGDTKCLNGADAASLAGKWGRERYVGRTSYVDEYVGSAMSHVAISFVPPAELGFAEQALTDSEQATLVCARISFAEHPLDAGYLIHHIRKVAGGSEMRSRFWLGGPYASVRVSRVMDPVISRVARRLAAPKLELGHDLLVHCSQEMSHLASFLPKLYAQLRDANALAC